MCDYLMLDTEYRQHLENTLEMPNFTSWEYSANGFTYYRYICGKLQINQGKEWQDCVPLSKARKETTNVCDYNNPD